MNRTLAVLAMTAMATGLSACSSDDERQAVFPWSSFSAPSIENGPWVRWWWPGNDVDPAELTREVIALSSAGFGGAEIQAFNAALDPEVSETALARRYSFDSDDFYANVRSVADQAREVGFRFDLNLGSGWSTGGAHIAPEDSMQTLLWGERMAEGPGAQTFTFDQPDMATYYQVADMAALIGEPLGRYMVEDARLVEVVAAKIIEDGRNTDIWDLKDTVVLDPDSVEVLTDKVVDGVLTWDVPDGKWDIIGFFACPDGQYVHFAALSDPETAFVVDHFNKARVVANLEHLLGERTGLADHYGTTIRGFFNDSFEMTTERFYTDDFIEKFNELRGYDLRPYLPVVVLPGADNHLFDAGGLDVSPPFALSEFDERIRYDYQRTVSDLFIERFVASSSVWGEQIGLMSRIQPYGLRVDVMQTAGAAHIGETEQLYGGGTSLFAKVLSSSALLYNRPLVSAETLVWTGVDHTLTPRKLKAAVDKLFVNGINHVIYHGFAYRTGVAVYGDNDWHPFSSPFSGSGTYASVISESGPFWPFMDTINEYVARVQFLLRQGKPRVDLLVYYPWLGLPGSIMRLDDRDEPLFLGKFEDQQVDGTNVLMATIDGLLGSSDVGDATRWLVDVSPILSALDSAGYTWAWVNDERLATISASGTGVAVGTATASAVLVLSAPYMRAESAMALGSAMAEGAPVIVSGGAPVRQPGAFNAKNGDAVVESTFAAVLDAAMGKKTDLDGEQVVAALSQLAVVPTMTFLQGGGGVLLWERVLDGGVVVVFMSNPIDVDWEGNVVLPATCVNPMWLDPWANTVVDLVGDDGGNAGLKLAPYGSGFLVCGAKLPTGETATVPVAPVEPGASAQRVGVDGWRLNVVGDDVPGGVFSADMPELSDWRDVSALAYCSTPGEYTTTVTLDSAPTGESWLDLGWLHGCATVKVNDVSAGEALVPPYRVRVDNLLQEGENRLSVTVIPSMRNRLVGRGNAGDATAVQYKGKDDTLVANGLIGPVNLILD